MSEKLAKLRAFDDGVTPTKWAADRIRDLEAEREEARKGEAESEGNLGHALHQLRQVKAENARLRYALRAIGNLETWPDNLMGDKDIARAALEEKSDEIPK